MAEEKQAKKKVAKKTTKKTAKKTAKKAAAKTAAAETVAPEPASAKSATTPAVEKSVGNRVSITLKRSLNRRQASHKACVHGLGLRRIGQTVSVADTPENRGMIRKVNYLLSVEEA